MRISTEKSGEIGIVTATAISLNAVIGAGPFGAPTTLLDNNGIVTFFTYAFVLFTVWAISYSLSRIGYLYPQPGSFYAYVYPWGGVIMASIAVTLYLASIFTAMAVLTNIASDYFTHLIPFDTTVTGYIILAISLGLNIFRLRFSQISQLILLAGTVFLLLATIGICLVQADWRNLVIPDRMHIYDILTPSYSVIFGFLGFETATGLYNIVVNPKTTVPSAITYSVMCTGILYLLFITGLIIAIPRAAFEQKPVLLTTLLHFISPHTWALTYAIHGALFSAIIGTLHATVWSSGVLMRTVIPFFPKNGRSWENLSIIVATILITVIYTMLTNIDFGLRITVIMRGITYLLALFTLLRIPQEWLCYHNYIAVFAAGAVAAVLYFAIV